MDRKCALPLFRCTVGVLAVLVTAATPLAAGKFNRVLSVGDEAPDFEALPGVDGQQHALADYDDARLLVLVFTCNHCPVAQAYQERLVAVQRDYHDHDVKLVAISCSLEEADGLPAMAERAEAEGYNFPYLHDAGQTSGRAYGVRQTPTVFVLQDGRIAYLGAIDDRWSDPARVKRHYLREALDALLAGQAPRAKETRPEGCEVKYARSGQDKP